MIDENVAGNQFFVAMEDQMVGNGWEKSGKRGTNRFDSYFIYWLQWINWVWIIECIISKLPPILARRPISKKKTFNKSSDAYNKINLVSLLSRQMIYVCQIEQEDADKSQTNFNQLVLFMWNLYLVISACNCISVTFYNLLSNCKEQHT